jgi:hypothetical protein
MLRTKLTDLVADAQGDAMGALLNGGFCDAYDGAQPETANDPVNGQTLCFSLGFGDPAFLPAEGGVLQANPMTPGVVVAQVPSSGIPKQATWFRTYLADHETPVFDGSIGTKDANMLVKSTLMVPGVAVNVLSFTHVIPKALPGT